MINLWDPTHLSLALALLSALLLGVVHGFTPDEHTWPITFSYSIGSYSTKGGLRTGLSFSLAFSLQRAIAAELAYVGMSQLKLFSSLQYELYVVVGVVMAASGWYVLRSGRSLHLGGHSEHADGQSNGRAIRVMPWVHGFIAGWGVGAFAIVVYTVLAPATGSVWLAWTVGAAFGLGTMVTQVILGMAVGTWMSRRHLAPEALARMARCTSGRILTGAGLAFVGVGAVGSAFPALISGISVVTPLHVHNLHHLGSGFFLAVVVLGIVAGWSFRKSMRELAATADSSAPDSSAPGSSNHCAGGAAGSGDGSKGERTELGLDKGIGEGSRGLPDGQRLPWSAELRPR